MIENVNVEKLKQAEYNARVKLEKGSPEYEAILKSIKEYGYVEPIVWNKKTGNVVGGHQRLQVLKDLGKTKIQVSVVELSLKDEKQLSLALNKIKGKWDYEKLKDVLKSINTNDIIKTGFTADEVAVMLEEDDIGEIDFGDWEFEPISENYILTLKFKNYETAKEWAEKNGYNNQVKEGTNTTVIRIEHND